MFLKCGGVDIAIGLCYDALLES